MTAEDDTRDGGGGAGVGVGLFFVLIGFVVLSSPPPTAPCGLALQTPNAHLPLFEVESGVDVRVVSLAR